MVQWLRKSEFTISKASSSKRGYKYRRLRNSRLNGRQQYTHVSVYWLSNSRVNGKLNVTLQCIYCYSATLLINLHFLLLSTELAISHLWIFMKNWTIQAWAIAPKLPALNNWQLLSINSFVNYHEQWLPQLFYFLSTFLTGPCWCSPIERNNNIT